MLTPQQAGMRDFGDGSSRIPPSDDDLAAVERAIGRSLPADYVAFMRLHNGGYASNSPIALRQGDCTSVNHFFSLSADGFRGESVLKHLRAWKPLIGPSMLPIATDAFGSPFCLNVDDGAVYFVDHESAAGALPVAPNFGAFVDLLGHGIDRAGPA